MRNYINKTIYFGIDVHKKSYAVTAICEGQVVKRDTLKAEPDVLIAYCKKHFADARIESVYEAGFCGFHLHRCLEAAGFVNMVVNAAGIEIAVGDRVKTDKRDSLKLATHLAGGRLKGIYPNHLKNRFFGLSESSLESTTAGFANWSVLMQYEPICDRRL